MTKDDLIFAVAILTVILGKWIVSFFIGWLVACFLFEQVIPLKEGFPLIAIFGCIIRFIWWGFTRPDNTKKYIGNE